jgi:hypothetical protein
METTQQKREWWQETMAATEAVMRADGNEDSIPATFGFMRALIRDVDTLEAALAAAVAALEWATGSADFSPEGFAHVGWMKVGWPALEGARAALAPPTEQWG